MASVSSSAGAAAAKAAQAAALVSAVKQASATSFIGFTIATALYGITVLQTYLYFRSYKKDSWSLKSTVIALLILDTLTTIFVAHSLYTAFILDFDKSPLLQLNIPWSFNAEKLVVTIITFIVQCFYARILWRVKNNIAITTVILLFAAVTFGMGIYTSVHLFENPSITSISDRPFNIATGLVQGFASLDDVLIAVAMCYYLHNKRTGFRQSSEKLIDTLIIYAVSRGVITALCQILFLVLNVSLPHDTYWQPFHQAVGKLYVNSVLATLNVRDSLNEGTIADVQIDSKGNELVSEMKSSTVTSRLQFNTNRTAGETLSTISSNISDIETGSTKSGARMGLRKDIV